MERLEIVTQAIASQLAKADDQECVQRLKRGDTDAMRVLYAKWQGPVYRFAWHMSGSQSVAEEVTQETFLAMLEKPAGFDPAKGPVGAYLIGIARNILLRHVRDTSPPKEPPPQEAPSTEPDPWAALSRQELVDTVRAAVVSLPLPYREAVALCDLEEVSYEAASQMLDCPVGTVRSRLSRGRLLVGMKLKEFARSYVS